MFKWLFLSSLFSLVAGCGDASSTSAVNTTSATPEAVANALFLAVEDTDKVATLLTTEAAVKASFECSAEGMSKLMEEFANKKRRVLKNYGEWFQSKGGDSTYNGFVQKQEEIMPAGTSKNGCTLKEDVSMLLGMLDIKTTQNGKERPTPLYIELWRFNGQYFLAGVIPEHDFLIQTP